MAVFHDILTYATNDDLLAGGDDSDGVDKDGNKVSWLISFNVRSQ